MWTAEVPCLFRFVLTKLSQGDSTRFVGVFNKTIIPLALLGCEMIIANSYPTRPRGIIVNCTVNNNYFEENIKKPIMNKKMVLFVSLVTTILLYDLAFNISCFFPEKCFFFLHLNCGICFIQSCHNGFYFRSITKLCKASVQTLYPFKFLPNSN